MQELFNEQNDKWHSALRSDSRTHAVRVRVYQELLNNGIAAPRTLVADAVAAVCSSSIVLASPSRRKSAIDVASQMIELKRTFELCDEDTREDDEARTRFVYGFLATWFVAVKELEDPTESIVDLDLAALQINVGHAFRSRRWMEWRSREEEEMKHGGSPALKQALLRVRADSAAGFNTIDQRIWYAKDGLDAKSHRLNVPASKCMGTNGEPFRSHIGPFHEIGAYTIPPDPTRLVSSDLALFAAKSSQARALLVSKIADASLMVRFGSMPRPARRRPRILFVAALEDEICHHVHRDGESVPAIDPLREILIHAIPACLRSFVTHDVDVEFEVRREGCVSRGLIEFTDIRTKRRHLRLELKRVEELVKHITKAAPWFIDDSFASFAVRPPPRRTSLARFDAGYLLSVGGASKLSLAEQWTAVVSLEEDESGYRKLVASGAAARPVEQPDRRGPLDAWGACIATCFDAEHILEHIDSASRSTHRGELFA